MDYPIQIGNYRLGKNLGIGAFGKVKRKPPTSILLYFILCAFFFLVVHDFIIS
jgi:hypothetical protein